MAENGQIHSGKRFKKVGPNLYRDSAGRYYLLVKKSGKQFRRSLKTTDPALAKRRLREFMERAGQLSKDGTNSSIRFEDLAGSWLASKTAELKASSAYRRKSVLKQLTPFFAGRLVRAIGASEFEAWKIQRGAKLSARSWNIEVETLKQIFDYAHNTLRILIDNPARHLKRKKQPKPGMVIPSKGQFRALVGELRVSHRTTGEAADLVEFLAYSGCRVAEAVAVRWPDINTALGTVLITGGEFGTKNYEARTIPLFAPLARLVESMRQRKGWQGYEEKLFRIDMIMAAREKAAADPSLIKMDALTEPYASILKKVLERPLIDVAEFLDGLRLPVLRRAADNDVWANAFTLSYACAVMYNDWPQIEEQKPLRKLCDYVLDRMPPRLTAGIRNSEQTLAAFRGSVRKLCNEVGLSTGQPGQPRKTGRRGV
jgi:integrase